MSKKDNTEKTFLDFQEKVNDIITIRHKGPDVSFIRDTADPASITKVQDLMYEFFPLLNNHNKFNVLLAESTCTPRKLLSELVDLYSYYNIENYHAWKKADESITEWKERYMSENEAQSIIFSMLLKNLSVDRSLLKKITKIDSFMQDKYIQALIPKLEHEFHKQSSDDLSSLLKEKDVNDERIELLFSA